MLAARAAPKEQPETSGGKLAIAPPSITLPKSGGIIRRIGEKFAVNPIPGMSGPVSPINLLRTRPEPDQARCSGQLQPLPLHPLV